MIEPCRIDHVGPLLFIRSPWKHFLQDKLYGAAIERWPASEEVSVILLCDPHKHGLVALAEQRALFPKASLIVLDETDEPIIIEPLRQASKAYFKRELLQQEGWREWYDSFHTRYRVFKRRLAIMKNLVLHKEYHESLSVGLDMVPAVSGLSGVYPISFCEEPQTVVREWSGRSIDVFYAATGGSHYSRNAVYNELRAWADNNPLSKVVLYEDPISPALYKALLLDSKVVVSPPGGGLDCLRHWEAVASGAVLVAQDDVRVKIEPYEQGVNAVLYRTPCELSAALGVALGSRGAMIAVNGLLLSEGASPVNRLDYVLSASGVLL